MILEALEHGVSRQIRVNDLRRRLNLNRLFQRDFPNKLSESFLATVHPSALDA